ncbi:hypothetical protein MAR_009635 [Mya arenaria]|uniref:Uncharacterized protein n=1 Tax=Mya arenaria TaxID=6604 RepID=A0ABY7E2C3_MYAAR|nr:hypothetical protein MAR_009635 [Mya arenaria]
MDGSTDVAGDEQETVYIRTAVNGADTERFLSIGKLVAMVSDGASNMMGVRSGLSTLLKEQVNSEIKSYKNKQGLKTSIEAMGKGVYPTKVTGTRWLPHLYRGIGAMLRTYNALEAHFSTASHGNPREGLLKLFIDKQLLAFALLILDALEPAMRLSLKLQKPCVTLSESLCWVESTMELMSDKQEKTCEAINQLLVSGKYERITLKGTTAAMKYADTILQEYGNEQVRLVYQHFENTLRQVVPAITVEGLLTEWNTSCHTKSYFLEYCLQ